MAIRSYIRLGAVFAGIGLLSAAVQADAPTGVPTPTCNPGPAAWIARDSLQTPDQIRAAQQTMTDEVAVYRTFETCLRDGLAVLRGDWKAAGAAPDPVVEHTVTAIIVDRRQRLGMMIARVNDAAALYDASLPQGDPGYIGPLAGVEATIVDADQPAPVSAPPSVLRLTIASQPAISFLNCVRYYPPISLKLHESGTAIVGFDVDAAGAVVNVHIVQSSGSTNLDGGAMACVASVRYMPAITAGKAAATAGLTQKIAFNLLD